MNAVPTLAVSGNGLDPADLTDGAGAMRFQIARRQAADSDEAVLVLAALHERAEPVAAALDAGKLVLCPFPPAPDLAALAAVESAAQRGRLLTFGAIADSAPGARAVAAVREGTLGQLLSVWAGVRAQRGHGPGTDILHTYAWDVLDFLLCLHDGALERAHARCENLFDSGPSPDTALLILRFAPSLIATAELSRCLPASIAAPDAGETEIELIGTAQTLRLEPNAGHVRVYCGNRVTTRPWSEGPLSRVLDRAADVLASADADGSVLERTRRAIAIMDAVRTSAAGRRPK